MKAQLKGRIQVAVRAGDKVLLTQPWQNNLILDQGLDYVASTLYNQLFAACAVGTSSDPTERDPGTTATVSGTALTSTAAAFSNADLDANVVFDTGQIAKILGYTSPTQVILATSLSITTATHFVVSYVGQAILGNEVKRTVEYLTTPGACGSIVTNESITLYRTFLFTPEAIAITYTELGLSPRNVAGANLFSRIVLAKPVALSGPSDEVPNGQQLQVKYELQINFDYGQGPGIFFTGNTKMTSIPISNLPISYSIWQYQTSPTQTGQLAVTVSGTMPVIPGGIVTLTDPGGVGYNYSGNWTVLDSSTFTDPTNGPSTILSLSAAWQGAASGGTLNVDMGGYYFRACQGIFLVDQYGNSAAPSPTPNYFIGYDEPSIGSQPAPAPPGQIWISTAGPGAMGSNGVPFQIPVPPNEILTVTCVPNTYAAGSFKQTQNGTIAIDQNGFTLLSFGFGAPDATNQVASYYFDQAHALSPLGALQLSFSMSWARG